MKILFLDTETTGLPAKGARILNNPEDWPHIAQIAWEVYDGETEALLKQVCYVIYPESWVIPESVAAIHGVTQEIALATGKNIVEVLKELYADIEESEIFGAHNLRFDLGVIGAAYQRYGIDTEQLIYKKKTCTMDTGTDYCKLPSNSAYSKYKSPRLSELLKTLTGEDIQNAHTANADTAACATCFFALRSKGFEKEWGKNWTPS